MYVTNTLVDFLNSSAILSDSSIYLTNLEKFVFSTNSLYFDKAIGNKLKSLLDLYIKDNCMSDYMNTNLDSIIPLISNDNILNYKSQIILPVVEDDCVSGLLIFTTNDRIYLPSNLEFAKTTKHFTEIFCSKKFL